MSYRLQEQPLEWIDRSKTVNIEVEGKPMKGFAGDTISSTMLANGVIHMGRSFKYHRIRGSMTFANHDINALFQNADKTNVRGDVTAAEDGLKLFGTNTIGGIKNDKFRFLGALSRFLVVGFYYKALFKPRFLAPMWERIIRESAGLGKVDLNWKSERKSKRYGFCDVLVIGAGPAGLSAAKAAAEAGASVMIVDENVELGGSLDYQYANDDSVAAARKELKDFVLNNDNIEVHTSATALGWYSDNWVPVNTANGIIKVRANQVVMATGLFEQPSIFHHNDVPGVMMASAAQRMIARYAIKPCEVGAMVVANEDGYRAALDLLKAGVKINAIADLEDHEARGDLAKQVKALGVQIYDRHAIYEVEGLNNVVSATLCPLDANGECDTTRKTTVPCDGVFMSVGWAPVTHLLFQCKAEINYNAEVGQFRAHTMPEGMFAAGRVNGVFDINDQMADGAGAGQQAAAAAKGETLSVERPALTTVRQSHEYPIFSHPKAKNFLDFDEDIQLKDYLNAAKEGFDNIELVKRFSTNGMGPSQGKHSNMNGIRILSKFNGASIDDTGSTTARPMFHPTPLQHLGGRRFRAERTSPVQQSHIDNKAVFMEAGAWLRPEYYDTEPTRMESIHAEAKAVRTGLGIIDVSTLGKIEIFGPDAAEMMDRICTMRMSNMLIGKTRYALVVDEAGVITDDGVVVRYTDEHFYYTTTSGSADPAFRTVQKQIAEWGLNCEAVNRTAQLAAMNLAGPEARNKLAQFTDIDLSEEAFPYLGARTGHVFGKPVTLARVGFVGELGYEIHCLAGDASEIWNTLLEECADVNIRPFGVECQRLLRLEKGHVIVTQDTDGLTNPWEAGMPWACHMKKDFFIGQRSLEILKPLQSRTLRGFMLPESLKGEPKECHLLIKDGELNGRITSVSYSPTFNRYIGLAYVDDMDAKVGDGVQIRLDDGTLVEAELVSLPFYDPEGKRQTCDVDGTDEKVA
jgi:sarcosine oxidase, subunit alpha